ncbi:hypothetical protein CCY17_07525 [Mediterraneibacter gnavus]|jgi:hypothetical protein|nr:hypothetical protein CCY17_07525 [Mediterraneibacter gnavus]
MMHSGRKTHRKKAASSFARNPGKSDCILRNIFFKTECSFLLFYEIIIKKTEYDFNKDKNNINHSKNIVFCFFSHSDILMPSRTQQLKTQQRIRQKEAGEWRKT